MRMPWSTSTAPSVEEALAEGDVVAAARACRRRGWNDRAWELLATAGDDDAYVDARLGAARDALFHDHALAVLAECAQIAAIRPDDERVRAILARIAAPADGPRDRCRAPFFDQLCEVSLIELTRRLAVRQVRAGDTIAAIDARADTIVVVVRGEVAITETTRTGEVVEIARLGEGGVVGPRSAREGAASRGAMATRATQWLELRRDDVVSLAADRPDVARAFGEVLAERALR
jgi:hypothetical protein